jgi:hypothetical protein
MSALSGMQVFRVSLNPKPGSDADKTVDLDVGTYRARKPHKKSRGGCIACKQKRKKVCSFSTQTCHHFIYTYDISVMKDDQNAAPVPRETATVSIQVTGASQHALRATH